MKQCNICLQNKSFTEFYTNGTYRGKTKYKPNCKDCDRKILSEFSEKKKQIITEKFGDKCAVCGYNKCFSALELHHVDSGTKEYHPSSMIYNFTPLETFLKEIAKCVMLCSNCHREVHEGLIKVGIV